MSSKSSRTESVSPELLLSLLQEPERPILYMSEGFGPVPTRWPGDEPEHVRALVVAGEDFEAVQEARERWIEGAEVLVGEPLGLFAPAEVAEPSASSRWSGVAPELRAEVLARGLVELLTLSPQLLLFHLTPKHGGHVLSALRAGMAARVAIDSELILLDHLVFAGLTFWLLREPAEALVVGASSGSMWYVQPGFPRHARVWRRGLACAPRHHVGGLIFAELTELILRAGLARRRGEAPPASTPLIVATLRAAEAAIAPRVIDILAEGDRHGQGPAN